MTVSIANPVGNNGDTAFLEPLVVTLSAFTDDTLVTPDATARIFFQRYVQSEEGIFDVTDRANVAGSMASCPHVRFFDPDGISRTIYAQPDECNNIAQPLGLTDAELQAAYDAGDFSISINGFDVVNDLGFSIKGLYDSNGDPITFTEFQPGNIYVNPQIGMFMFFHHPMKWDECDYWDMAWWDSGDLSEAVLAQFPYVTEWDSDWPTLSGNWEDTAWDDIEDSIPVNTYWDIVSEAPGEEATVLACYWTQDDTDPIVDDPKSRLYTSPLTLITDTQLRFRSIDALSNVEDTNVETYTVGLRVPLNRGLNLVSQPRVLDATDSELNNLVGNLEVDSVYRIENGLWEVFTPTGGVKNDFTAVDNQHGYFFLMNGPGNFCVPYGESPVTTTLTLADRDTNRGFSAIGVPRSSIEDNSITNLLDSRDVTYEELFRVTNGVFETFIVGRADILNFDPADLSPGRGYGVITSTAQTFELPFID